MQDELGQLEVQQPVVAALGTRLAGARASGRWARQRGPGKSSSRGGTKEVVDGGAVGAAGFVVEDRVADNEVSQVQSEGFRAGHHVWRSAALQVACQSAEPLA